MCSVCCWYNSYKMSNFVIKYLSMIRTFQPRLSRAILLFSLLPCTIVTVYGFWMKLPILGFVFLLLMILNVERLIHSVYTLTDDGWLLVSHGRFARIKKVAISEIDKIEIFRPSFPANLWHKDWVGLTLHDGKLLVLEPSPAEPFCRALLKKKEESCSV